MFGILILNKHFLFSMELFYVFYRSKTKILYIININIVHNY